MCSFKKLRSQNKNRNSCWVESVAICKLLEYESAGEIFRVFDEMMIVLWKIDRCDFTNLFPSMSFVRKLDFYLAKPTKNSIKKASSKPKITSGPISSEVADSEYDQRRANSNEIILVRKRGKFVEIFFGIWSAEFEHWRRNFFCQPGVGRPWCWFVRNKFFNLLLVGFH